VAPCGQLAVVEGLVTKIKRLLQVTFAEAVFSKLVLVFVFFVGTWSCFVMFSARSGGADVGVLIRVNVDPSVVVGATPGAMVDEDCVTAPTEACTAPTVDAEGRADDDGGAEADGSAYYKAWAGCVEDNCRIVDGNVIVGRVDGLDFDVAAVVDDRVVGGGG